MLHTLGFLWLLGGSRGSVGFLLMFFLLLFVLRVARGSAYRSRWRGGYGPRYHKYYRPQDPNQGRNQNQGKEQPTQNPYYGAPGNYSEGSGTGAETVRTDSGVETHRVDNTEGVAPTGYGEPTRPLEGKPETPGNRARMGGQVYDGERDDTTGDQS